MLTEANLRRLDPLVHHGQQGDGSPAPTGIIRQPDTKPVSAEDIQWLIDSLDKGLRRHEEALAKSLLPTGKAPRWEQYRALASAHRSLLEKYSNFLLATQHPSAGDKVHELGDAIPEQMRQRGIKAPFDFLSKHLPASAEFMEELYVDAHSLVTYLGQEFPSPVWKHCLGELNDYRGEVNRRRKLERRPGRL